MESTEANYFKIIYMPPKETKPSKKTIFPEELPLLYRIRFLVLSILVSCVLQRCTRKLAILQRTVRATHALNSSALNELFPKDILVNYIQVES